MSYPNYSWTLASHRIGREMLQENAMRAEARRLIRGIDGHVATCEIARDLGPESCLVCQAHAFINRLVADAKDAIPPGPEGATAPISRFDAWMCRCGCIRRDHDDLGRCQSCISCVGFQPANASAEDRLANLFNAFADDVEQMSDEELIAEIVEDGGDPEAIAERTRRLLQDTVERFKTKQAAEASASPVKEERDDA